MTRAAHFRDEAWLVRIRTHFLPRIYCLFASRAPPEEPATRLCTEYFFFFKKKKKKKLKTFSRTP